MRKSIYGEGSFEGEMLKVLARDAPIMNDGCLWECGMLLMSWASDAQHMIAFDEKLVAEHPDGADLLNIFKRGVMDAMGDDRPEPSCWKIFGERYTTNY